MSIMPAKQNRTREEYIRAKGKALFDSAMHDKTGYEKRRQALKFHAEILNKRLQFFTVETNKI